MTKLKLIYKPNPILKKESEKVKEVDDEIRSLMKDMLETMKANDGIGLAAVQVGVSKKVIVMDLSSTVKDIASKKAGATFSKKLLSPIFMANAEIISSSKKTQVVEEGCLSVEGITGEVSRPAVVRVRYINYDNELVEESFGPGLISSCVQHEIDHTNGILFVDRIEEKSAVTL